MSKWPPAVAWSTRYWHHLQAHRPHYMSQPPHATYMTTTFRHADFATAYTMRPYLSQPPHATCTTSLCPRVYCITTTYYNNNCTSHLWQRGQTTIAKAKLISLRCSPVRTGFGLTLVNGEPWTGPRSQAMNQTLNRTGPGVQSSPVQVQTPFRTGPQHP